MIDKTVSCSLLGLSHEHPMQLVYRNSHVRHDNALTWIEALRNLPQWITNTGMTLWIL